MVEQLRKSHPFCRSGANHRNGPPGKGRPTACLGERLSLGLPGDSRVPELPLSSVPDQGPAGHRPACTLFESCLAPLCPLDPSSLKGIWYPDEEICRSRSQGGRPWIKSQRRLARVAGSGAGYFTLEMLGRLVVIRKGITGLDPDIPEEQQLRAWFQKRPERLDPSPGNRASRSCHLKKFSFWKRGGGKGSGGGLKRGRDGMP